MRRFAYPGKLLLRGQNGSGKSITTQNFIPFILDGDRTRIGYDLNLYKEVGSKKLPYSKQD